MRSELTQPTAGGDVDLEASRVEEESYAGRKLCGAADRDEIPFWQQTLVSFLYVRGVWLTLIRPVSDGQWPGTDLVVLVREVLLRAIEIAFPSP